MAYVEFPLQFKRQYSGPLDPDFVFATEADMNTYVANSSVKYAGQLIVCVATQLAYIVNAAMNGLTPVGVIPGVATDSTNGLMPSGLFTKLNGIAAGAEVNVNPDWNAASGDAQILNKPDVYTKLEVNNLLVPVYKFKGNVANYASLPSTGQANGEVYNCVDTGINYAWTGSAWDDIGGVEATATDSNQGLMPAAMFTKLNAMPAASIVARKYTSSVPAGQTSTFDHNFGTRDVSVTIRDTNSPFEIIGADVELTTTNRVTLRFGLPAPTAGQYTVTIVG